MAVIRLGNLLWRSHTRPISPTDPVDVKDVNSDAIKNKVDTLATETKLEQVRTLLAGVATEDKLEQARALLQTISGKDFATQTTLAQVKSELELVKAELQAIKANQLSGDQKVQLSGTKIELIKEHIGVPTPSGLGSRYIGETTSPGTSPLDVSGYREVAITIRNQGSAGTQLYLIVGYNGSANTNKPTISDDNGGQRWKIPAGARLVLNRHNTEVLKNPNIGLRLTFYGATEESVVDVEFVGVK